MPREPKKGLDYFFLDTALNNKFKLIEAEFGIKGFAVIVKLFQRIYGEVGYYCEWTKEVATLFAIEVNVKVGAVSEIVEASFRRGIFDKDLYLRYNILTSRGIQRRYLEAVGRRVKIELKKEYLLLSLPEIREKVGKNAENIVVDSINDNMNTQRREEKRKEDYLLYIAEQEDEKNSIAEIPVDDVLLREMTANGN